jgi:hypothetical protein
MLLTHRFLMFLPADVYLQDAIMVEIIAMDKQNSVLMSVETAGHLMSEEQLRKMIDTWAVEVQKTLELL